MGRQAVERPLRKFIRIIGREEKFGAEEYNPDNTEGIIPRSIRYLWHRMSQAPSNVKYLVKASFLEIYNETINDLTSSEKTNLNCRWNSKNVC